MDKFKEYLKIEKEKFDACLKASTDKINDLKSKSQKNEPKSKNTKAPNKKVQKKGETKPVVSSKHRQKDARVRKTNEMNRQKVAKKTVDTKVRHSSPKKNIDVRSLFDKFLRMAKHDFSLRNIKKYPHIFVFPLVFVYFELMLRICSGTSLFAHLIYPVLFGIATGFFVSFITLIFPKKINRKISIVVLFGTGFVFIVQCLIKRSFQWYMPFAGVFAGADNIAGNYLSEAISAIFSGIPAIILFFMPGVLYVLYGKTYLPVKRFKFKRAIRFLGYAFVFMFAGVLLASIGSSAAKYKSQYKFDTATEYFGLLTSLRLETKYSVLGNKSAEEFVQVSVKETTAESEAEKTEEKVFGDNVLDLKLDEITSSNADVKSLNAYVESLTPSKQNEYTGLFEGKNLILIAAEAFSDVVIDKELTPTLYRMTHNGFYFSDFYQPTWGGSTSTGEYSFLVGLMPLKADQTMYEARNKNLYFTLGNQLQREGYYSAAFHNGTHDFYNRDETHTNLGYSTWMALGNGLENYTDAYPDDEQLFETTMDIYMDQQPFSIYYMTISGHSVYTENGYTMENMEYVESILGSGNYKDTTMNYFCYQMELEHALTRMIEKLEEAGIADDTVICMTSDHYPYGLEDTATFGNSEDYVADLYGYDPSNDWEQDHNSWIIWSGCLENEHKDMVCEIETPTYSLDIVPTLSNLFGLDYDSRLLIGRDVFSDAEPLVLWNSYSWVTTEGKYDGATGTFYPNEGSDVDEAYVERINAIAKNKISFSAKAINNNYYKVLFGKDTENGKALSGLKVSEAKTKTEKKTEKSQNKKETAEVKETKK